MHAKAQPKERPDNTQQEARKVSEWSQYSVLSSDSSRDSLRNRIVLNL